MYQCTHHLVLDVDNNTPVYPGMKSVHFHNTDSMYCVVVVSPSFIPHHLVCAMQVHQLALRLARSWYQEVWSMCGASLVCAWTFVPLHCLWVSSVWYCSPGALVLTCSHAFPCMSLSSSSLTSTVGHLISLGDDMVLMEV
jgi:hypothetical protein